MRCLPRGCGRSHRERLEAGILQNQPFLEQRKLLYRSSSPGYQEGESGRGLRVMAYVDRRLCQSVRGLCWICSAIWGLELVDNYVDQVDAASGRAGAWG